LATKLKSAPRSGLAKQSVTVLNSPGTIDADYRGEIKVIINHGQTDFTITRGERIAQMVVAKYEAMNLYQVNGLDKTSWGRRIRINRCLRAICGCSMYTMSEYRIDIGTGVTDWQAGTVGKNDVEIVWWSSHMSGVQLIDETRNAEKPHPTAGMQFIPYIALHSIYMMAFVDRMTMASAPVLRQLCPQKDSI
jgi:hypothetical protein